MPPLITHCLMKQYAQYHGELAVGSKDQFRSRKLDQACEAFGITPGGHRALADAEASRQVLLAMADVVI
jgi:DNA polymerase III epsilon subunit-like protein